MYLLDVFSSFLVEIVINYLLLLFINMYTVFYFSDRNVRFTIRSLLLLFVNFRLGYKYLVKILKYMTERHFKEDVKTYLSKI